MQNWIFPQCEKSKKGEVLFLANFCFKAVILGSVVHKNMRNLKDKPFCLAFVDCRSIKKNRVSLWQETENLFHMSLFQRVAGLGRL
jgi:hypothetical protein